jgi:hypothetical protein
MNSIHAYQRFQIILRGLTAIVLVILLRFSCCAFDGAQADKNALESLDKLYRSYLQGDLKIARESLDKAISILEELRIAKPGAVAHGLWLAHSRLQVLERRSGRATLADANLLKARFWYLRKLEQTGESTEKAYAVTLAFGTAECETMIDRFDRAHTDGRGPEYLRIK